MMKSSSRFVSLGALSAIIFSLSLILPLAINAQGFSGSSSRSWTCEGTSVYVPGAKPGDPGTPQPSAQNDPKTGKLSKFVCVGKGKTVDALPVPPELQQVEIWFVRIIYSLWALAGVVFTGSLIYLGFTYMTSRGQPDKIAEVVKRIQQWGIGFVLVFLAYPILNTVFAFIGLNPCITQGVNEGGKVVDQIQLPGFQFFFGSFLDPTSTDCNQ